MYTNIQTVGSVTYTVYSFVKRGIFDHVFQVVDKCLMDGADEYLQLMALFTTMMREICRWSVLGGCWPMLGGDADQCWRGGGLRGVDADK